MKSQRQLPVDSFRWVPGKAHQQISPLQVALQHGVPENTLTSYLKTQNNNAQAFKTMPLTLLMAIAYSWSVLSHDPVVPIRMTEADLKADILDNAEFAYTSDSKAHKSIEDVGGVEDIWDFFTVGYIPLLFQQERGFSDALDEEDPEVAPYAIAFPPEERGFLMQKSQLIGGVRFRIETTGEREHCENLREVQQFTTQKCSGGAIYENQPELPEAGSMTPSEHQFWVYSDDDVDESLQNLSARLEGGWIDIGVQKVEVAMPIYNHHKGVHSIIYTNFYFSRGGRIWSSIIALSTPSSYFHTSTMIPDALWSVSVFAIFILECMTLIRTQRRMGWDGLIQYITRDIFFISDILIFVFSGMLVYIFSLRWAASEALGAQLTELQSMQYDIGQPEEFRRALDEYVSALDVEVHQVYTFRTLVGSFPLINVLRMFKAFSAQPRLAVPTRTVVSIAQDLLHFMIVAGSVFVCYVLAGCTLFGTSLDEFINTKRSFVTTFFIMMGFFDFEELASVGRFEAGAWFMTFFIVVAVLMLNMLLAMILEAYGKQTALVPKWAPSLTQDIYSTLQKMQGQAAGGLISLKTVMAALKRNEGQGLRHVHLRISPEEKLRAMHRGASTKSATGSRTLGSMQGEIQLITTDDLQRICPDMRTEQAVDLLTLAIEDHIRLHQASVVAGDALHTFMSCNANNANLKKAYKHGLFRALIEYEVSSHSPFWLDVTSLRDELHELRRWLENVNDFHEHWRVQHKCKCGKYYYDDATFCLKCGTPRLWELKNVEDVGTGRHIHFEEDTPVETPPEILIAREMTLNKEIENNETMVQESLSAVSQLEMEMFEAEEQRTDAVSRLEVLKEKIKELVEDTEHMNEEEKMQEKRLAVVESSRLESRELLQTLEAENRRIKTTIASKLAEPVKPLPPPPPPRKVSIAKEERSPNSNVDAGKFSNMAYEDMVKRFEELMRGLDSAAAQADASRGGPGLPTPSQDSSSQARRINYMDLMAEELRLIRDAMDDRENRRQKEDHLYGVAGAAGAPNLRFAASSSFSTKDRL
eukprot:TRINITY_DN30888_c0_g1_i1.p1 TRINITY_DN30888_c0_g1~~TRINITY_DN30888_c0_g1_i1.p1  ORF type:complete len:1041 (-),score=205.57 TRINITY_DN30888_c0_g1_i1:376-3498(-)